MVAVSYSSDPTFQVTGREELFDFSSYLGDRWAFTHHYDVTRDGRTFVVIRALEPQSEASPTIQLRLDYLSALSQETPR